MQVQRTIKAKRDRLIDKVNVIQIYNKDKADFTGDQTLSGFISFLIAGIRGKRHAGNTLG